MLAGPVSRDTAEYIAIADLDTYERYSPKG